MNELRVVDAGRVGAARSQALWHGIASAMETDSTPTLSFCRSAEAYVCLGFHHPIAEVDEDRCRRRGLPILRRRIGGGPVYMDGDQLLFQLTLPVRRAPLGVERIYRTLLGPAVTAFRTLGAEARLAGLNDIAVGDRKISGTGAGQIGGGVTVVGNVIFAFPHDRMVEVLRLPDESMRRRCLALMRRHLAPIGEVLPRADSVDEASARETLIRCYGEALGLTPRRAELTPDEEAEIAGWEGRLVDPAWVAGPRPRRCAARRVKITAEVWACHAEAEGATVGYSVVEGALRDVEIAAPGLNGLAGRMCAAMAGLPADRAVIGRNLEPFGALGRRILAATSVGLGDHR